jgi:hypothetical protein
VAETFERIRQEHLDALCPELRLVVADAVAAGNSVAETWDSFGHGVLLTAPRPVLVNVPAETRSALTYRAINDPHYWLGEIFCTLHFEWFVALPFEPGARELPSLGLASFDYWSKKRRLFGALAQLSRFRPRARRG